MTSPHEREERDFSTTWRRVRRQRRGPHHRQQNPAIPATATDRPEMMGGRGLHHLRALSGPYPGHDATTALSAASRTPSEAGAR